MMLNWNEYHQAIRTTLGEIMKLSPDTLRGYRILSEANAKTSNLGAKTRELIALGVAVTRQCDGIRCRRCQIRTRPVRLTIQTKLL